MKVAILHLSDLHIDKDNADWLTKKTSRIVAAVWDDFSGCGKIVISVTGDIAMAGTEEQYRLAKLFFRSLLRAFAERNLGETELENRIVCVPGNHDCNYERENKTREMLLAAMRSKPGDIDRSVYENVSSVQDEYRAFARDVMIDQAFPLGISNMISVNAGDKTVLFRLYNTAWMSVRKEEQGSIVMPMDMMGESKQDADLVISLFHHHYSWMTPGCDNNKHRFRKHIMQTSNMVLYGHEHTPASSQVIDHYEGEVINEFEGGALCLDRKGRPRSSSFSSMVVDMDSFDCVVRSYVLAGGIYSMRKEETVGLSRERKTDEFRHNPEFLKSLKKMSVPIHNSENVRMTLDDFFVYPDLERINTRQLRVDEEFTDSSSILSDRQFRLAMLEGDDQSGKTSLLSMFYIQLVERYEYPVLVKGKNMLDDNLDRIISGAFSEQYSGSDIGKYAQYDWERKVLLIDNFDECPLSDTVKKKIINQLMDRFHKVIITTRESEHVSSSYFLMEKKDTLLARIKPLGHVKRNELVKKFYATYDANISTLQQQAFLERVKAGFDMVENFLGKEYMPSYPIYILSILLSNTKMQNNALEQTSYGYCYEALITCALMTCVEDKTKIDRYYNVLMNLAYFIYGRRGRAISEDEFADFYRQYEYDYFSPGYKEVKSSLLKCNLLRLTDDYYYKFSYSYIYYFLVAKYMADNIHSSEGEDDILDLCDNIHDEQKANILIFIAHHIKNPQFIAATQLALTSALGDQKEVTLNRDDDYYRLLNELCESLKKEIVDPDEEIDPEKEREKMLRRQDEHERLLPKERVNPNELSTEIQNLNKSLRSIEVVGQIVKNRQGSLRKPDIKKMVADMYSAAFRTISYFGTIIESEWTQVMDDIISNKKEGVSSTELKKKIDTFFELTSLNFCLFVFSKVINSVGNKELRSTFTQIANEKGTPAAKLVSFSMISCYSKIAIPELEALVEDLRDNPVAMSIVRARVRSYLYNNYISRQDRQKLINTVNLSPKDSQIASNRPVSTYKRK